MITGIAITIDCSNEAMQTEQGLGWVLADLANAISTGQVDDDTNLYDINGNKVGFMAVEHGEENVTDL